MPPSSDQQSGEADRSIVYQRMTSPTTWLAILIVVAAQITALILYPDQPGVSVASAIGLFAGMVAMAIVDHSAVSEEIRK